METFDIEVHDPEGSSTRYSIYAADAEQALRICADGPVRTFIIMIGEREFMIQAPSEERALRIAADRVRDIAAAGVTP